MVLVCSRRKSLLCSEVVERLLDVGGTSGSFSLREGGVGSTGDDLGIQASETGNEPSRSCANLIGQL